MGSLILPELRLDCRLSSIACGRKTIGRFLAEVSKINRVSEKISKLDDYVNRLQDEMKKIDAFKRELPLCMLLLSDAISATQEELAQCKKSNNEPVFEEFIPLKKTCSEDKVVESEERDNISRDKMSWMSSVQLWSSDDNINSSSADLSSNKLSLDLDSNKKGKEEELSKPTVEGLIQSGKNSEVERAFVPLKGCSNFPVMSLGKEDMDVLSVPGLSLCTPGIKNSKEGINPILFGSKSSYNKPGLSSVTNIQSILKTGQQQTGRKQRRCWSAELHRQFINALNHLGGPQAATPKQIREHMQIDGLTNDEVKSHLQKYRLHMKRVASNSNSQSVGFWMSQEDHNEFLKQRNSQSNSPEGPLEYPGDSIDDEYDAKSESSNCKPHIHA